MTPNTLSSTIKTDASSVNFNDVITLIDSLYNFTETAFTNGSQKNNAGENNGSCKIFAFAKLQSFNKEETLACFGQYYQDVLNTPEKSDHQNIRQFIQNGWDGIVFSGEALTVK